jgi:hypothetical protein
VSDQFHAETVLLLGEVLSWAICRSFDEVQVRYYQLGEKENLFLCADSTHVDDQSLSPLNVLE